MNQFLTHGAISWPELTTDDVDAAAAFYASVLDWETETMPTPKGEYTLYKAHGAPVCGMMKKPNAERPLGWTFYVTVDDVQATVALASKSGGTVIMSPMTVGVVGTIAGIRDPQGAVIMVVEYDPNDQDNQNPEIDFTKTGQHHGVFSWFELRTSDAEAALKFYGKLFGWHSRPDTTGQGPYHMIDIDGVGIGGALSPPMGGAPPHWGGYITVADIDTVVKNVRAAGGVVAMEAMEIEVGRFAMIQDPRGAQVSLMQYASRG